MPLSVGFRKRQRKIQRKGKRGRKKEKKMVAALGRKKRSRWLGLGLLDASVDKGRGRCGCGGALLPFPPC